jgi:hypothetical protein
LNILSQIVFSGTIWLFLFSPFIDDNIYNVTEKMTGNKLHFKKMLTLFLKIWQENSHGIFIDLIFLILII